MRRATDRLREVCEACETKAWTWGSERRPKSVPASTTNGQILTSGVKSGINVRTENDFAFVCRQTRFSFMPTSEDIKQAPHHHHQTQKGKSRTALATKRNGSVFLRSRYHVAESMYNLYSGGQNCTVCTLKGRTVQYVPLRAEMYNLYLAQGQKCTICTRLKDRNVQPVPLRAEMSICTLKGRNVRPVPLRALSQRRELVNVKNSKHGA